MPKLRIYRIIREDGTKVEMPKYAHESGDACFDIYAGNLEPIVIKSRETVLIPSGLVFEPELGYHIKLQNRSSMGAKNNVQLSHCTGIVDNSYRGEVFVPLFNRGKHGFVVEPGMRICQAELAPDVLAEFEEVEAFDELSITDRGSGGFGSSGK